MKIKENLIITEAILFYRLVKGENWRHQAGSKDDIAQREFGYDICCQELETIPSILDKCFLTLLAQPWQ